MLLNFSKEYTGGGILNTIKSFLPIVCGVPQSALNDVNKAKYSVTIRAFPPGENVRPSVEINAWLQEKIEFSVASDWIATQDLLGSIKDAVSSGVQLITGKTLNSTMMTRRKWKGSSPISLNLKLKFEAINDVGEEVLKPCYGLKALVLPSGGGEFAKEQFFLNPPGPNPFYLGNAAAEFEIPGTNYKPFGPGEQISIDIGGFLKFESVILKNVKVTFENRMSKKGPVGALVDLTIETYEMLTRESLSKCYGVFGFRFGDVASEVTK